MSVRHRPNVFYLPLSRSFIDLRYQSLSRNGIGAISRPFNYHLDWWIGRQGSKIGEEKTTCIRINKILKNKDYMPLMHKIYHIQHLVVRKWNLFPKTTDPGRGIIFFAAGKKVQSTANQTTYRSMQKAWRGKPRSHAIHALYPAG